MLLNEKQENKKVDMMRIPTSYEIKAINTQVDLDCAVVIMKEDNLFKEYQCQ